MKSNLLNASLGIAIIFIVCSCAKNESPIVPDEPITPEMAFDKEQRDKYSLSEDAVHVSPFKLADFADRITRGVDKDKRNYTIVTASVKKGYYVGLYSSSDNSKISGRVIEIAYPSINDGHLALYHTSNIGDSLFASVASSSGVGNNFTSSILFDIKQKTTDIVNEQVDMGDKAIPYIILPWYDGNFAMIVDLLSASSFTIAEQNNRIIDHEFNTLVSGFSIPDTSIFKKENLISNTEAIKLDLSGSAIYIYQNYLLPTPKSGVPWNEEVTSDIWYVDYLEHPKEILFEKIEDSNVAYTVNGRTLILSVQVSGWVKPAFVDGKANEEYFEQKINKEISVDLDTRKVVEMKNL